MEPAETALCPYCRAPYVPDAVSCAACKATYPWAGEIAELRGQLKERETSRVRATATLTNELYRAARGEGAVSIEAVKGFVLAWLFPRVVVVIGSLMGAGLLAFQTYISWSQTKLLVNQEAAAQVDRAEKIRQRLEVAGKYEGQIKQLSNAVNLRPASVGDCRSSGCADTPILALVNSFSQSPNPTGDAEAVQVFGSIVGNMDILRTTTKLGIPVTVAPPELVNNLIDPASIQCAFDAKKARAAEDSIAALSAIVSTSGFFVWKDAEQSVKRGDAYFRFMRALSGMHGVLTQGRSTVVADRDNVSIYDEDGSKQRGREYTLGIFVAELRQVTSRAQADLDELSGRCSQIIAADLQTLAELYPQQGK